MKRICTSLTILSSAFFAASMAENVKMCAGEVCAQVLGQSGKIDFTYGSQSIQVTMDSITEKDADGNTVGNTGNPKHSFNSFASQDFVFSELYNTTYQGLDATAVNFTASLVDATSNFAVQLYLFLDDGEITNHNNAYNVTKGSFKFSYTFDYWPFCTIGGSGVTDCTKGGQQQEGEYLDFTIILKGNDASGAADDEGNSTLVYDDGTAVFMPSDYYASEWEVMPSGYPLEDLQGSKTIVTFRFNRFDAALDYDPILNWGTDAVDDSGSSASTKPALCTLIVLILAIVAQLL